MKVLLLGEFSAVHKFLKEGLQELGHEATLIANGDGWKQISGADKQIYKNTGKSKLTKLWHYVIEPYFSMLKLPEYDVLQLMNTGMFHPWFNTGFVDMLRKKAKLFSLLSAGDDYTVLEAYNKHFFEYFVYDFDKSVFETYDGLKARGKINMRSHKKIVEMASVVIPCAYEYQLAYKSVYKNKTANLIPMPINVDSINCRENSVGQKVVFFHGLNRELAKGTPFIRQALERLKEKYPNEAEIIIDGRMSFEQYLKVVEKANVIIDQCVAYGYGMTSCTSMAKGKVVMAGNHPEMQKALGIKPPVIWIKPDVEHIYSQLEWIVENRFLIPQIGYESRKFIEEHHHYLNVAQQYVDTWKAVGK